MASQQEFCELCGAERKHNATVCTGCGEVFKTSGEEGSIQEDSSIEVPTPIYTPPSQP